jgi:pimeloyl-ACP methyl ester carboxylesterase
VALEGGERLAVAVPQPRRALLVGFDWGGRGACFVSALWPERVRGLVTAGGYNIQNIAGSVEPAAPEREHRIWYQYYFHTECCRAGLAKNRDALCKLLWQLWSPSSKFDDATYQRTAASFHNPDFVDVVVQGTGQSQQRYFNDCVAKGGKVEEPGSRAVPLPPERRP